MPSGLVTPAGGGTPPMLTAEVTLTDANIKAFGAGTIKQLVAAPGAGKALVLQAGFLTIDAVAGAYGNINVAATVSFVYATRNASTVLSDSVGSLTALLGGDGEITCVTFGPEASVVGGGSTIEPTVRDASELANSILGFSGFNSLGAFNGGNAANSGRAKVWYTVETLP